MADLKTVPFTARASSAGWGWPLLLAYIRLPLALAGSGLAILAYQWAGNPVGVAAGLGWSTLTLTIVNLLCLGLLAWRARVEGFDLWGAIGFQRRRLLGDLGWGLAWSLLLGGLLLLGVFAVMLAVYGAGAFGQFEAAFTGEADFSFTLPAWLAVVSAVAFPVLNPVVEELQYRGYAQPRLIAAWGSAWLGIVVTAAGFGLQHVVFALTPVAAAAYAFGFFLWGLGAGLIAHRQRRLAPLIVAHFVSNASFGVIPLLIMAAEG
jgi:membrane protease YdiL (CAAX protease family)